MQFFSLFPCSTECGRHFRLPCESLGPDSEELTLAWFLWILEVPKHCRLDDDSPHCSYCVTITSTQLLWRLCAMRMPQRIAHALDASGSSTNSHRWRRSRACRWARSETCSIARLHIRQQHIPIPQRAVPPAKTACHKTTLPPHCCFVHSLWPDAIYPLPSASNIPHLSLSLVCSIRLASSTNGSWWGDQRTWWGVGGLCSFNPLISG
jgi:hypothetical protein